LPNILINGLPKECISVLDRGFQYGDGLFETLQIFDGEVLHWQRHIRRLSQGCGRLAIPMPEHEKLRSESAQLSSGVSQGTLKITVTRGVGGRGYSAKGNLEATRVVAVFPAEEFPANIFPKSHWQQGVNVRLCHTRLAHNVALAGIKHLNRLEQVLARAEWDTPNIAEGLMLDNNNNVIEGTMSNVFCIKTVLNKKRVNHTYERSAMNNTATEKGQEGDTVGGETTLFTPDLSRCGVAGITRERILDMATQLNIPVCITDLTLDDLEQASEVFLSNSLIGIWPVRHFMARDYSVGPVTQRLSAALGIRTGNMLESLND